MHTAHLGGVQTSQCFLMVSCGLTAIKDIGAKSGVALGLQAYAVC